MKTILLCSHFLSVFFLMSQNSCQPEYSNDSRIFIEGKVISPNTENFHIKLTSKDILISETNALSDGSFKLGGPGTTGDKSLSFNKRIKSFSASHPECRLSYDSMMIFLPAENYFKFSQITFEP